MKWQPMDTAPMPPFDKGKWFLDGPRVLLLIERGHVTIGAYGYTERGKGRWRDHYGRTCVPTRWMPLPASDPSEGKT